METIKVGVVGLGYVGIPLAIAFNKKYETIGFDISKEKIEDYKNGIDVTKEVGDEKIKKSNIEFTNNSNKLVNCNRIIVAVPTPVNDKKEPDLNPVIGASEIVGKNLSKGTIVIYESTVYPGLTEEICIPILEECSGMKCGEDFKVAYSPERVNPGDKIHRFENIKKIVSGIDDETLGKVAEFYESVLENGVYKAKSIKVAEMAKVIENSQRDVNIAFANEIAIMCHKLEIDTNDVLDAACTKWNFLNFRPGLVGGHCIGVDPYYLITKLEKLGYDSLVLANSRKVNENMSEFIVNNIIKKLKKRGVKLEDAKVQILGVTFKENVNDTRNSKIIDIIKALQKRNITVYVKDPHAKLEQIEKEYNLKIDKNLKQDKVDVLILAVAHEEYKKITYEEILKMLNENRIVFDIKNILIQDEAIAHGIEYWRL